MTTQSGPSEAERTRFHGLVAEVAGKLGSELTESPDGDAFVVKAHLAGGRSQMVFLNLDGDTVRFSTRCTSVNSGIESANLYKILLQKNYRLRYGYFALNPDGGVELVATQLMSTCDAEELTVALLNLATVGDFMERELGQSDEDVF